MNDNLKLPNGIKLSLVLSAIIGLGVMFLTTINHAANIAIYAGIGTFCISLFSFMSIWAIVRWVEDSNK